MATEETNRLFEEIEDQAKQRSELSSEMSLLLKTLEQRLNAVNARVTASAEEESEDEKAPLKVEFDRPVGGGNWAFYYRQGKRGSDAVAFTSEWSLLRDAPIAIKIRAVSLLPTLLKRIKVKLRIEAARIQPALKELRSIVDGMKEGT